MAAGFDQKQDALQRTPAALGPVPGSTGARARRLLSASLFRPLSLRVALALLVFSVMLPTAIFFAIQYRAAIGEKQNEVKLQGRALARDIANDVTYEIEIKRVQLAALALSNRLRTGDLAGFYEQCKAVEQTTAGWIALYRADGAQLFNTRTPLGQSRTSSQIAETVQRVSRSGRAETSDLFVSRVGNDFIISVLLPVPGGEYVLGGSLPTEHLSKVLRRVVPEDWIATLVDRNGVAMARSRNEQTIVGTKASADLWARLSASNEGWTESKPVDGNDSYTSWYRLPNDWTAIATVDRAVVQAPLVAWQRDLLRGLGVFSLLGILLALIVANWIIGSMRKLETAAADVGTMQVSEPISTPLTEINKLGEILHRASLERRRGELANAHLAALVSSSGDAIKSIDLDGRVLTWNAGAEELYGYSADEIIGKPLAMIIPEEDIGDLDRKIAAARAGRAIRFETRRRRKDGRIIEISLNAAPIRDSGGNVIAVSTIAHDITQRKRDEAHMQFIMRELSHRSKNLLSVIISFARQTWNQSKDFHDFEHRFAGRLHALARSHDLLVRQDWRGAGLEGLVQAHLAPFAADDLSRLDASGPNLFLKPDAVQNLGYAFHELATNAAKYGSLSRPDGRVTLRWDLVTSPAGGRIHISWTESGGPPVTPPERRGLGSMLTGTMTERALGATVVARYEPSGFVWEIDIPAERILRDDLGTTESAMLEPR